MLLVLKLLRKYSYKSTQLFTADFLKRKIKFINHPKMSSKVLRLMQYVKNHLQLERNGYYEIKVDLLRLRKP